MPSKSLPLLVSINQRTSKSSFSRPVVAVCGVRLCPRSTDLALSGKAEDDRSTQPYRIRLRVRVCKSAKESLRARPKSHQLLVLGYAASGVYTAFSHHHDATLSVILLASESSSSKCQSLPRTTCIRSISRGREGRSSLATGIWKQRWMMQLPDSA